MQTVESRLEQMSLEQLADLRVKYSTIRLELKAAYVASIITLEEYTLNKSQLRALQLALVQAFEQRQAEAQRLIASAEDIVAQVVRPDTIVSAERFKE